jgi:hypothetical protein
MSKTPMVKGYRLTNKTLSVSGPTSTAASFITGANLTVDGGTKA